MLRSLVLPIACAALLGGCATGYSYRADRGDYYYGQPEVEYRYYGSPYDYGYGAYGRYGYYGPYRRAPGYGWYGYGGYGYPYRYGYGYGPGYGGSWGWPYSGHPHYVRPRPRPQPPQGGVDIRDRDGAPWRNLDELGRRRNGAGPGGDVARQVGPSMPQPRMDAPRPRRDDSGMGRMIRETRERRSESTGTRDEEP